MACVLRASGAEFDVDAYLAQSPFAHATVYRKGEPWGPAALSGALDHGFNVTVSHGPIDDLGAHIDRAIEFLDEHEDELRRLGRFPGVEGVEIDFGIVWRELSTQTDAFPPELLWRAGALDIGLRVTYSLVQQRES